MARADLAARLLTFASIVALAGCGGSGDAPSATPTARQPSALDGCARPSARAKIVRFAAGSESLHGVVVGSGEVGVVLAHQLNANLCSWLPFARRVADEGGQALAFDFGDRPLDTEVRAAAAELRRRGAQTIVLVGASMGGTASLVAASEDDDVTRVASLSGPRVFQGLSALRAARRLTIPALFIATSNNRPFTADARGLFRASPSKNKDLLIVPGFEHGTDMLRYARVRKALVAFVFGRE